MAVSTSPAFKLVSIPAVRRRSRSSFAIRAFTRLSRARARLARESAPSFSNEEIALSSASTALIGSRFSSVVPRAERARAIAISSPRRLASRSRRSPNASASAIAPLRNAARLASRRQAEAWANQPISRAILAAASNAATDSRRRSVRSNTSPCIRRNNTPVTVFCGSKSAAISRAAITWPASIALRSAASSPCAWGSSVLPRRLST